MRVWSNLKPWQKGAIVGAMWGLISVGVWILFAVGAMAHAPLKIPKAYSVIFFPGYVSVVYIPRLVAKIVVNPYSIAKPAQFLIFFGTPIIIGVIIGSLIVKIIELVKKMIKVRDFFIFLTIFLLLFFVIPNHVNAYSPVNHSQPTSGDDIGILSANEPLFREIIAEGPWRLEPNQTQIPIGEV